MAKTHETQNLYSMSRLKESAFGTPVAWGVGAFRRILTTDRNPWGIENEQGNDAGYAQGSDRPENSWNTTNGTAKSFSLDFNFQDAPYWFQMALGAISSSGSSPEYTHDITPQSVSSSRQLPSRTFLESVVGNIYRYTSGCVNSLTISGASGGENQNRLSMVAEVIGNGAYSVNPASYADPGNSSGLDFGYNHFASLTIDDGSSPVTHTCNLVNWSWVFNNDLQPQYDNCASVEFETGNPEAGLLKTGLLIGVRDYKFNFTAYLESSDPTIALMKAGTIVDITSTITATYNIPTGSNPFSCEINHSRGKIISASRQAQNGYVTISGVIDLLSSNGSIPLTVEVVNDVASYTS